MYCKLCGWSTLERPDRNVYTGKDVCGVESGNAVEVEWLGGSGIDIEKGCVTKIG